MSKYILGGPPPNYGPGRNPPCCDKAREIVKGAEFCVCACRAYCPDHGTRCIGSHD